MFCVCQCFKILQIEESSVSALSFLFESKFKQSKQMLLSRKNKRCTRLQIEHLVDYMLNHTPFANGEFIGPMGRRLYHEEWMRLAENLKDFGPDKSLEQWRCTWRDLKKKARLDITKQREAIIKNMNKTGKKVEVPEISEISKKILAIMGAKTSESTDMDEMELGEITVYRDDETGLLDMSPPLMPEALLASSPTSPAGQPLRSSLSPESSSIRQHRNLQTKRSSKNEILASDWVTEEVLKEINKNTIKRNTIEEIKTRRDHSDRLRRSRLKTMEFLGHKR